VTSAARRGFAGPVAVCLLAVLAAGAAASFQAVVQARRAAFRSSTQEQAASEADLALHAALTFWTAGRLDSLAIGGVDSTTGSQGASRLVVIRVTEQLFWFAATARVAPHTSVQASRSHHLLVEVLRPVILARAALMSRADILVGFDASVVGADTTPPGWSDCAPPDDTAGASALVPDGYSARREGGEPLPGARSDSVAGMLETYEQLGHVSLSALSARADLTLPAGAILSPEADTAVRVVRGLGDLTVTGDGGRGVIVVDGHLRIRGPYRFAGVIVARGGIDASGPDVSVYGTVLSAGAGGVVWRAAGTLRRSSCAIERASRAASRPYVVGGRGWAELF